MYHVTNNHGAPVKLPIMVEVTDNPGTMLARKRNEQQGWFDLPVGTSQFDDNAIPASVLKLIRELHAPSNMITFGSDHGDSAFPAPNQA